MKKLLTLLLLLITIQVFAQTPVSPVGPITTNTQYYEPSTGRFPVYRGTTYSWTWPLMWHDSSYYVTPYFGNTHYAQLAANNTLSGTNSFTGDLLYNPATGSGTPVQILGNYTGGNHVQGVSQSQLQTFLSLKSAAYTTKSVYNAADYGAVDDSLTDCAAPIQRAIDTAHAHGGGIVMLPIANKGKILVGSTIFIPGGVTIQGQSTRNPIVFNNGNFTIFSVTGQGASLAGMIVDAYGFFGGTPGRTGHALDLIGATSINVSWFDAQNVEMLSSSSCVYINGTAATSQPSHSVFYNCIFFNTSATLDTTIIVKNLRYAQFYGCSMFSTASPTAPSRGYWDIKSQYGEWNGGVVGGFSIRGQDFRATNVGAAGNVDFYGLRPNYVGSTINGNLTIHPTDTSAYISTTILGTYIDSGVTTRVILTSQSSAGGDLSGKFSNITVSGIKGNVLPSLSSGLLRWNGSAWVFDNTTYYKSGDSPTFGTITSGDIHTSRNATTGYIYYGSNLTNFSGFDGTNFTFNAGVAVSGSATATSFIKSGGTGTNLLNDDGTVTAKSSFAPSSTAVTGGVINWPGTLYSTPTTATYSSGTLTFAPMLATQSAYKVFGNFTSGSDTPNFSDTPTLNVLTLNTSLTDPLIYGSIASGGTLTLSSTSNATKGKILFGNSAFDELHNWLGIGTSSPTTAFQVNVTSNVSYNQFMTLTAPNLATAGNIAYWNFGKDNANVNNSILYEFVYQGSTSNQNAFQIEFAGGMKAMTVRADGFNGLGYTTDPGTSDRLAINGNEYVNGGYTQSGTSANIFTGTTTFSNPILAGNLNNGTTNGTFGINNIPYTTGVANTTIGGGSVSNSSGTYNGLVIQDVYNQTSTAASNDLFINRTNTAVGSGAQNLILANVGGSTKFSVDVSGNTTAATFVKSGATTTNYLQAGGADRTPAQVLSDINATGVFSTTVSAAGTLSLSYATDYFFSGTTATYTLPAVSSTLKGSSYRITIKNRGSGNLTVNSNAGGNDIYDTSAVSTITVLPGAAVVLINDGTYLNKE